MYPEYDPCEFDGSLFSAMDRYKRDMLAGADLLRARVAATRSLGDIVTGDVMALGRAVIQSMDMRNQNPFYPPVFLTFHQYPEWVAPSHVALSRMKFALRARPKFYRRFASDASAQPIGGLFELNIYAALDDAFPGAEPQPRLAGTKKHSDVRIRVDDSPVYVESTVLDETRYWRQLRLEALAAGQSMWSAPGPGPAHGARRIVSKISRESMQTTDDAPNIIFMSFFDCFPIPEAREWAFDDLWEGGTAYGTLRNGERLDLSRVPRVDSIFEFSRDQLLRVHVNPHAEDQCRLTEGVRNRIRDAVGRKLMIR